MTYRREEYYSPEAKRQVDVMDALQGQVDIRLSHARERSRNPKLTLDAQSWHKGYVQACYAMTHTLGEMSARLLMEEQWRHREASQVSNHTYAERLNSDDEFDPCKSAEELIRDLALVQSVVVTAGLLRELVDEIRELRAKVNGYSEP